MLETAEATPAECRILEEERINKCWDCVLYHCGRGIVSSAFVMDFSRGSQRLGVGGIRILSFLLFWPTLAGLVFSTGGSGRTRFLGIGTCLATGLWCFTFWTAAAISMGPSIIRHPVTYLVPDGYVGWIRIKHGEDAPRLDGKYICRIPTSGIVSTSSDSEEGWARDEYFYYSDDGSLRPLRETGWGGGGMIWAGSTEWEQTTDGNKPKQFLEKFYVGKEDQYRRNENHAISENQGAKIPN